MKSKKVVILKEGERFGRLTVIREVEPKIYGSNGYVRYFLCKCDERQPKPVETYTTNKIE